MKMGASPGLSPGDPLTIIYFLHILGAVFFPPFGPLRLGTALVSGSIHSNFNILRAVSRLSHVASLTGSI